MNKSLIYLYFLHKRKKIIKSKTNLNEINICFKKTFKNCNSIRNKKIINKYQNYFLKKYLVSDNVLITENISLFLNKIKTEDYLYISNKVGYDYFNKIYENFLKTKKNIFYEKIKSKKELIDIIKSTKKNKINLICIGGGKVIDIAKFIALKANVNLITIPTILATHVYASPKIHVLDPIKEMGYKNTIDGNASNLSLIDLNIIERTFKENNRLIYSGMGDLMAFYNAKLDWFISKRFKKEENYFLIDSINKVEGILENIDLNKPLKKWIKQYIFAQVLLCNITDWAGSAPASGTEHFFANLYEKNFPGKLLHGELVALGTLIFSYIRGSEYINIVSMMKKFKIFNFINKLNTSRFKIIKTLSICKKEGIRKKRYSILNKKKITKIDFRDFINQMVKNKLINLK